MIRHHHERWDGAGYPHGLAADAIPLAARILCIADVYDALTTNRPYRQALTRDDALRTMRQDADRVFDAALLERFERIARTLSLTAGSAAASRSSVSKTTETEIIRSTFAA